MKKCLLTALLFLGGILWVQAQSGVVSGTVYDEENNPLPGVSVVVKGTKNGQVTDAGGNFRIAVPDMKEAVLVFSYLDFETREMNVQGHSSLNVNLKGNSKSLGTVIVVGYGSQRKIATTGAIASVKASDLTQTPVTNIAQGLQARVAGVQITQNSAAPGGNISVRVRGTNSINGTSEPLYVIDGIQITNGGSITSISPLSTINPNDIESIEILKDASSTAIYGARAANGVVLITTKRGKAGATRVSLDSYYGVQNITKKLEVMNASQYAALENDIYKTAIYPDPASLGKGINWQDVVYRQAPIQSHQLAVSGGNEKTLFALSASYFSQDGIAINSNFKRYSFRTTLDHKISDRFKVGTSILGSYTINNGIPTGSTSLDAPVTTQSLVGAALGAPPTLDPYRADGTVYPFGDQFSGRYREQVNPLALALVLNRAAIKRTLINLYGEATILKGLTYRASFNTDLLSELDDYYSPRSIINSSDQNASSGSASKSNHNSTLLLHESILTYATSFAEKHSLKLTGVFASQSNLNNSNTINASGLPNDATSNEAVQLAVNQTVSSYREKQTLLSYLGRINYGYKDKFFFDITARIDGASKFGANHKYGFFPAAAGAWRIIEEDFMNRLPWVSDLKLRASYGLTGNAGAIDPYRSLSLSGPGSNAILNHVYTIGISPTGIANPDLRWERSIQADIGLDIGLFRNRLNIVMDYYDKQTKDLLFTKALPLSSGYSTITGNYGELSNKGFEFAANAVILEGAFKWNIAGNMSFNRNKVVSIDGGTTSERFLSTQTLLKVGEPLGIFKTYLFDGIYQTGETVLPGSASRTGGTKLKDYNKDGQITAADQVITGNPNPDFIYGFSTGLSYKNFDLSAFFAGSQGNNIYNLSRYSLENPLGQRNVLAGLVNRWSPTNPNNEYVSGVQGQRIPITDRFVEDGSYLRCKNISIGYTLPKVNGINRARIYVSGNNLFVITRYSGYDPEVNTYGNSNGQIGVDNLVYPSARTVLAGIQVTF